MNIIVRKDDQEFFLSRKMGHVIEHIALETQSLVGMECGFGRTCGTGEYGIYNVFCVSGRTGWPARSRVCGSYRAGVNRPKRV
jgi:hypothetical protein